MLTRKPRVFNPVTVNTCLNAAVCRPHSPGVFSVLEAWRTVNKMQLERLHYSPVTSHCTRAERRRRHTADGNYAGVSLVCLFVCLSVWEARFLQQQVKLGDRQQQQALAADAY